MEFIATLHCSSEATCGFTPANIVRLEQMFRNNVGDNGELALEQFKKILQSKNSFFAERMFRLYDTRNAGKISLDQFLTAIRNFARMSSEEKLKLLFSVYDVDGDGLIQMKDFRNVIHACMEENGLKFSEEQTEDLTMALFKDADIDGSGNISFQNFKTQLESHPGLAENFSMTIDRWLIPSSQTSPQTFLKYQLPRKLRWRYIRNNYVSVLFLMGFLTINIALFISRYVAVSNMKDESGVLLQRMLQENSFSAENSTKETPSGMLGQHVNQTAQIRSIGSCIDDVDEQNLPFKHIYEVLARACGHCLNFTCMFVLLPVLRLSLTWLRTHGFSQYLPVDHGVYFHKLTAWFIIFYSIFHTIMHICNFARVSEGDSSLTVWLLFTTEVGIGWVGGAACLTGWILLVILFVMFVCAQKCVRQRGMFEVFHYSHKLYIVFWLVLILHGPNFLKWFIGPALIFVVEMTCKMRMVYTKQGQTCVLSGTLLPSKVIQLVVKRPRHFEFCPGDYVFIRIPVIAQFEWHPFTISSAPELEDVITLHIRAVGEWTNRLWTYFDKQQMTETSQFTQSSNKDHSCNTGYLDKSYRVKGTTSRVEKEKYPLSRIRSSNYCTNDDEPQRLCGPPSSSNYGDLDMKIKFNCNTVGESSRFDKQRSVISEENQEILSKETNRYLGKTESQRLQSIQTKRNPLLYNSVIVLPSRGSGFRKILPTVRLPEIISDERDEENRFTSPPPPSTYSSLEESTELGKLALSSEGLRVFVEGPYGSPTRHIFRAEHAVLIATGIGVTPFASILQSIMVRYQHERMSCPSCCYQWLDKPPQSIFSLRKVDFIWINRNQQAFEWFVNLLSELEIQQTEFGDIMERFLDVHMYVTSALCKTDIRALGLQLALELMHEKEKRCLITGLKTRTQPGRPNWDMVFRSIAEQCKGRVTVFFCGPPQLARTLHTKCNKYGFTFRKEVF
ncbi:NADPH oxidase 5-like [Limulus polyphemus]|uniref:NADPH oxidase 5-like n=1 Tax=Limulus polyphemus TaxID=6850 RepID=A0ABM1BMN1_LIMPO|nr:NADPH oxidase 5-like [Limulus polyphemus]XP_022253297.1 NADPH oxidase 5-like [Limulus polyphemus]XP_022253299.1 NADPH oxidase 5-like [Limulus polyphemus]